MRLSSMFFALLFAPLALSAQTSSAVLASPQSNQSCPVRLTADRLAASGQILTGAPTLSEKQRKQLELHEQRLKLQLQLQALGQQKAAAEAKLAQQKSAADPGVTKDLPGQIQILDAKISATKEQIAEIIYDTIRTLREPDKQGQGLDITLTKPITQIVSADIVVHGFAPTAHIIPATLSAPTEITETFHLTPAAGEPLLHSSVWTKSMSPVSWVELTRLDYADGTSWQSSTPRQCSATPSLYVLVGAAR